MGLARLGVELYRLALVILLKLPTTLTWFLGGTAHLRDVFFLLLYVRGKGNVTSGYGCNRFGSTHERLTIDRQGSNRAVRVNGHISLVGEDVLGCPFLGSSAYRDVVTLRLGVPLLHAFGGGSGSGGSRLGVFGGFGIGFGLMGSRRGLLRLGLFLLLSNILGDISLGLAFQNLVMQGGSGESHHQARCSY